MNGFITYSFAPASSAVAIWSISVSVVTITSGSPASEASARAAFTNSKPLITGMFQSTSTTSGRPFSLMRSRPSWPLPASLTS